MIDTDIERLLYHMPVVAERASNAWTKKFATDMAKRARFRNWKPSNNQVKIMKELVAELFMPIGDDFCTVENP